MSCPSLLATSSNSYGAARNPCGGAVESPEILSSAAVRASRSGFHGFYKLEIVLTSTTRLKTSRHPKTSTHCLAPLKEGLTSHPATSDLLEGLFQGFQLLPELLMAGLHLTEAVHKGRTLRNVRHGPQHFEAPKGCGIFGPSTSTTVFQADSGCSSFYSSQGSAALRRKAWRSLLENTEVAMACIVASHAVFCLRMLWV